MFIKKVALYSGWKDNELSSLRYRRFCLTIAKSSKLCSTSSLPPTLVPSQYHGLRVYFQILDWKGNSGSVAPKLWTEKRRIFFLSLMTDMKPPAKGLLGIVYCTCRAEYSTRRYTCRASGLCCKIAYGQCKIALMPKNLTWIWMNLSRVQLGTIKDGVAFYAFIFCSCKS